MNVYYKSSNGRVVGTYIVSLHIIDKLKMCYVKFVQFYNAQDNLFPAYIINGLWNELLCGMIETNLRALEALIFSLCLLNAKHT